MKEFLISILFVIFEKMLEISSSRLDEYKGLMFETFGSYKFI